MSRLEELIQELCPNGVEYRFLGEIENDGIVELGRGKVISKKDINDNPGDYPIYSSSAVGDGEIGRYSKYMFDDERITWSIDGGGKLFHREGIKYSVTNVGGWIKVKDESKITTKYLYYALINAWSKKTFDYIHKAHPSVIRDEYYIPVPPLEVQREIVRILDKYTKKNEALKAELAAELTARKKQYEYYKNALFESEEVVEWKTLDMISKNCDSMRKPITKGKRKAGNYPYYGASGIVDYVEEYIFDGNYLLISEDGANLLARVTPIAFSITGKNWVNNHAHVLQFDDIYEQKYVEMYLNSIDLTPYITGAAQPKLNQKSLNTIQIPMPPEGKLRETVTVLERFDKLCNDITEGLPAEIEARQKQYEHYRDKLLTFKEKEA